MRMTPRRAPAVYRVRVLGGGPASSTASIIHYEVRPRTPISRRGRLAHDSGTRWSKPGHP
jgi:hypothetical protein